MYVCGHYYIARDVATFIESIDGNFGSTGTSGVDSSAALLRGEPYGEVALMSRKSTFPCVSVIPCDNPRIAAIKVMMDNR